jgi:hypothetical protein
MDSSSGYRAADIGADPTAAQQPLRFSSMFWSGPTQQKRSEFVAKV